MDNGVTKEDLQQFGAFLIGTIRKMIEGAATTGNEAFQPEWLKSRKAAKMMPRPSRKLSSMRRSSKHPQSSSGHFQ